MWCIDEYIMANIQNNLDFITAIEQEIHIWASSLFLCGLKREYQKQKKRTHRCICTYKNCTQESKIVAFVVFLSLLFSFYIPFTWFESFYGTCVACLLLPLLIFSLAMQRILPSEFSYSDVPYNILWIVRGHVRCMRACVCVSVPLCGLYATFLNLSPQLSQFHVNGFIGCLTVYSARIFRLRFPLRYFSPLTSYSVFVVRSSVGKLLECCCLDDQ